jgi:type II restriction/modification system DNA methylase subunit YeeA
LRRANNPECNCCCKRVTIDAKKQLAEARTERDRTSYENKCVALDRQIDQLVYELYGLTDDEIAIIEKG